MSVPRRTQEHNQQQVTEAPQQAPQSINAFMNSYIQSMQPQYLPPGATTTSRIIRDTGKDNGEMFLLDEDFFLEGSEKIKFSKAEDTSNHNIINTAQSFTPIVNPIVVSPVNIMNTIRIIDNLPIKIRYSEEDFDNFNMASLELAKTLLNEVFKNHPELDYSIVQDLYGIYQMSISRYNDVFKNSTSVGRFDLDLENWGGKGLPIMHGIVGSQYSDNHIIVPLGATKAVEQCIMAIAYNTGGGVDAVTEAKFKYQMLPEYIYATIDFSVPAFPDGLDNYKEFGKVIEHIDKYHKLKTRYRLYDYKDNYHFTLISDAFVKPFNKYISPVLDEVIRVENNTLTIKQPNGNTKVVQMGA